MKKFVAVLALGVMIALVSACAVNRQASTQHPGVNNTAQSGATVSLRSIQGVGKVLVSRTGMTLYSPKQEANGHILCTAACVHFWQPLSLPKGSKSPTKGPGISGKLALVDRPDGTKQVTFDGKPLYQFAEDASPGDAKGNDFQDSFGGHQFFWQAVTIGKAASPNGGGSQHHGGYGGGY